MTANSDGTALDWLAKMCRVRPSTPALHYFDATLTYADVDEASSNLAGGFIGLGLDTGDRVAIVLQNVPQFLIALLAIWKVGSIAVPLNPMLRSRELVHHLRDSGATMMVCLESVYPEVQEIRSSVGLRHVITTSELEYLSHSPAVLREASRHAFGDTWDWNDVMRRGGGLFAVGAERPLPATAVLSYTSGTTGVPRAAMNTHANIDASVSMWCECYDLKSEDAILAIAPLFHITGLMGHLMSALRIGAPVVLMHRFEPRTAMELAEQWGATFTVAPITAYIGILEGASSKQETFRTLHKLVSGGAPVAAATVDRFEEVTGRYIHNAYGLTESTSLCIGTPHGQRGPIDGRFGALSVGRAVGGTEVRILDTMGRDVGAEDVGEIVIRGPQVTPGYWGSKALSEGVFEGGWLHTGDVGKRDGDGWVYAIDRAKDVIIASGYKIWPREVEDVLHQHPAVTEAAVIGIPDEYRGETVKAFVSLRETATGSEIIRYCRQHLAAYKAPRIVEIVEEIPKTASGKFLRRQLRNGLADGGSSPQ